MRNPRACTRAACVSIALVAALCAAGLRSAAADDDDTFKVRGTVRSNDGAPIAGASVTISMPDVSRTDRTDARGAFVLSHVREGTYTLRASAPGYQPISQRTVTLGRSNSRLSIVLSQATTNSLTVIGEVRASAGETVSTASAPTISMSAQQAAAAGTTSVAPMLWSQLSTTPVIPLGGGSNATVSFAVRGPDPTETVVDIDGHQMNNGNTGDFDVSLLDPAALQEVQLVYGIAPSSLIGPNTIGGGVNIVTLEPTNTDHTLMRIFGGSYGTFGETLQTTGSDNRFGYAVSLHGATSSGSVNQTVLAPPNAGAPPADNETAQSVGSDSIGKSLLSKVRYQLGGENGYGYIQLNFRDQSVYKDESALLTTYTPPGFGGSVGDDVASESGGYQSFAGTNLEAHQANYGLDAQLPLGSQQIDGAPATILQLSHLTTLNSQSVSGPGADTLPYLYNQRDSLGDDWLELDHRFSDGMLSFKYDVGVENLTTNYVQGQVIAEAQPVGPPVTFDGDSVSTDAITPEDRPPPPVQTVPLSQTQRYGVLRYNGDPTSHIHYSVAAYDSDFSTFGSSFDPRAGFVWTPTGETAVRASVGTTFQAPQLSELLVPPPSERVPVGGVVYIGNPNLRPDHATDFDIGMEHIFGKRRPLHFVTDFYQTNLRSPSSQTNPIPIPGCQTKRKPVPCPISMPVNAGNGVYRGVDVHADEQLATDFHIRAGWDVDSSFLTVIPVSVQDGTLAAGEQSLGQPLHKAYVAVEQEPPVGLGYGVELNYEGWYNELNRSPYAVLNAHVSYRRAGWEYGLYGTNLTNVYSSPFTIVGGGFVYGGTPGQPVIPTDAYILQGAQVNFVLTRAI
ncbi:MAG: TonB-dependent receptor [Candidatus Cybelea sp.]|jgi:outer membrane receptor protein involved in Fe transport